MDDSIPTVNVMSVGGEQLDQAVQWYADGKTVTRKVGREQPYRNCKDGMVISQTLASQGWPGE